MILTIREFIVGSAGLSIGVAGVGAGSLIRFTTESNPVTFNQTIGETSIQYTSDNQWRFLYLLGTKVFSYLKNDHKSKSNPNKSKIKAHLKNNVIKWLEDKFDLSTEHQNTWQGFKDLCISQLKKEDVIDFGRVTVPESRLCFMGAREIEEYRSHIALQLKEAEIRGNLSKWPGDKDSSNQSPYSSLIAFGFGYWNNTNYQFWKSFRESSKLVADNNEIDDKKFKDTWNKWYNLETTYSYINDEGIIYKSPKKLKDVLNITKKLKTSATATSKPPR